MRGKLVLRQALDGSWSIRACASSHRKSLNAALAAGKRKWNLESQGYPPENRIQHSNVSICNDMRKTKAIDEHCASSKSINQVLMSTLTSQVQLWRSGRECEHGPSEFQQWAANYSKQLSSMIQVFWSQIITLWIQESDIFPIKSPISLTHHASPHISLPSSAHKFLSLRDIKL